MAFARLWCLAFGHEWVEPDDEVQELSDGGHRGRAYPDRCSRCDAERGPGYIAWTVYPGHCVVEGCKREALTFCDEHQRQLDAGEVPKVTS